MPILMADTSSETASQRSKKRQRQRVNQQRRTLAQDALAAFLDRPSFGNALRAWLAHAEEHLSPQEYHSATKFTKALRAFSSRSSGIPDYPEVEPISADALAQWVDNLAWSLNVKFVLDENARKKRTPTSRIGTNYRSLVHFLANNCNLSPPDYSYLLDECKALEEDLARTARVNRIMESYVWYVQEAYFDKRRTVDETYYGEYEIESVGGPRLLLLRRYDPDNDSDTSSASLRSFRTLFPAPLVGLLKCGDTMTLQMCHLEQNKIWVPYMYSGYTINREECGTVTPTARRMRGQAGRGLDEAMGTLQTSLRRLELDSECRTGSGSHGSRKVGTSDRGEQGRPARSLTPRRAQRPPPARGAPTSSASAARGVPELDYTFDESEFTEAYFDQWHGDIDTDEDFSDILRPPEEEREGGYRSREDINLYETLRERHRPSGSGRS